MRCIFCGAEMKVRQEYDYYTFVCPRCGKYKVAKNIAISTIEMKAYMIGHQDGIFDGIFDGYKMRIEEEIEKRIK